jgi:hypothetical protein
MELAAISQRVDEVALSIRAHDDGASKYAAALSADVAKSLSRSRNGRADGDGCAGLHLMHVSCSGSRVLTFAWLETSSGEDRCAIAS